MRSRHRYQKRRLVLDDSNCKHSPSACFRLWRIWWCTAWFAKFPTVLLGIRVKVDDICISFWQRHTNSPTMCAVLTSDGVLISGWRWKKNGGMMAWCLWQEDFEPIWCGSSAPSHDQSITVAVISNFVIFRGIWPTAHFHVFFCWRCCRTFRLHAMVTPQRWGYLESGGSRGLSRVFPVYFLKNLYPEEQIYST